MRSWEKADHSSKAECCTLSFREGKIPSKVCKSAQKFRAAFILLENAKTCSECWSKFKIFFLQLATKKETIPRRSCVHTCYGCLYTTFLILHFDDLSAFFWTQRKVSWLANVNETEKKQRYVWWLALMIFLIIIIFLCVAWWLGKQADGAANDIPKGIKGGGSCTAPCKYISRPCRRCYLLHAAGRQPLGAVSGCSYWFVLETVWIISKFYIGLVLVET